MRRPLRGGYRKLQPTTRIIPIVQVEPTSFGSNLVESLDDVAIGQVASCLCSVLAASIVDCHHSSKVLLKSPISG